MKRHGLLVIALLAVALLGPVAAPAQVVVNPAAFEVARPLAPGSLAAAFGDFSRAAPATAESLPLPTMLGGLEVFVGGLPAGIYAVTPTQVNFMAPLELPAGRYPEHALVEFRIAGQPPQTGAMLLRDASPAILLLDAADALRPAAALNQDGSLNTETAPAAPGDVLVLYLTGQGKDLAVPRPGLPPETVKQPRVFFRTWPGETRFSGLVEHLPGLWQINVQAPPNAELPPGATPIVVLFDGVASNTAVIWVE
jgi:uncharacterized protein (TIGR03437 family)